MDLTYAAIFLALALVGLVVLWPRKTLRAAIDPSEAFMQSVFKDSIKQAGKVIRDQHVSAQANNLINIHKAANMPAAPAPPPNG